MKNFGKKKQLLIKYVEDLEEEKVLELAKEILNDGAPPMDLLVLMNEGMNRVGKLYEKKDYFIADLIMAGIIFKQVLELEKMTAHFKGKQKEKIGKVVLGTVKGDIHDIGKDIFRGMLEANGFEVVDLGVDVPKEVFVKKTLEHKPDIVGLSGVLTSTADEMKAVVDALIEAGLRDQVRIIVGANYLTQEAGSYIGVDSIANEASGGIKVCKEWMNTNEQR
ncbi:cobalamin B12-binding domain-containing protein [Candidatus Formimonas warabiya]|uniref:Cobalamin-binding protein n=1 Tax=Formimonas warabiya TaxID=1761012 RepID=A0A3G1KMV9_FORW1|nr:cobalamin-dependent protein [Candidatus Formimonas warabiya]ATW23822.1 cobalamin-binding protein [Candidatus Formimonas warabiya]